MNGKVSKNIRLRNHKGDEAETWYTCSGHMPLYKLFFFIPVGVELWLLWQPIFSIYL